MKQYSGNIYADLIDEQKKGELLVEVDCPDCEGSGKLEIENEDGSYQFIKFYETCIKCNGIGRVVVNQREYEENLEMEQADMDNDEKKLNEK